MIPETGVGRGFLAPDLSHQPLSARFLILPQKEFKKESKYIAEETLLQNKSILSRRECRGTQKEDFSCAE